MSDALSFWEEEHEEAKSGGGNNFLFFKEPKTRVRLVGLGNDPREYRRKVESVYRGTKRPQYLVKGFKIEDPKKLGENDIELQAVTFTKGAWALLTELILEGYDFFSDEGQAVVVARQTVGQRVSYAVMPAPASVKIPIPPHIKQQAEEKTWEFYLEEHRKMQESNDSNGGSSAGNDEMASIADQILNTNEEPF